MLNFCHNVLNFHVQFRTVHKNTIVKGIDIHGYEVKISQFADDTTIFLDGSQSCLQAALNILEKFGTVWTCNEHFQD